MSSEPLCSDFERVLGLNHRNRWKIFKSLLLQNHLPLMFEIWFVALPGGLLVAMYRKNSKNWDTLNYYRDCPTNVIVGFYSAILCSKDADRITNRVDTDQTAP